jgi:hypothetical protein
MRAALSIAGAVFGVAVAVAGCGSVSGGGVGNAPSSPEPPGATGLRGTPVVAVHCSPHQFQPDAARARPVPAAPVRIVLCPLAMSNAAGPPTDLRPAPPALVRALALPDGPKPSGQYACAAYADVPRLVYAETADGSLYLIHIPVDACSHYLPAAAKVLDQYAQDGPVVG